MVDVDTESPYHPHQNGPQPILDALEDIGLVRCINVRSSLSQGIHIYFPLLENVSTWKLAKAAKSALVHAGIKVRGGICELFPNAKGYDPINSIKYNGHRLPLQAGACLLDEDYQPSCDRTSTVLQQWRLCAAANEFAPAKSHPTFKGFKVNCLNEAFPPLPKFIGPGESNEILKQLANYGDRYLKLRTIPELAQWIKKTVVTLNGYDEFCSDESKSDIRKNWCERWAKSHLISKRIYSEKSAGPDHNTVVSANALERLKACLPELAGQFFSSERQLWVALGVLGKDLFSCAFGWKTFQKWKRLWRHLVAHNSAHTVINPEGVSTQENQASQPANTSFEPTSEPPSENLLDSCDREPELSNTFKSVFSATGFSKFTPAPPGWSSWIRKIVGENA